MKLEQWMAKTETSDEVLAEMISLDRSSVSRIRRGKQLPSRATMEAISRVTGGAVTPNDFFLGLIGSSTTAAACAMP
jgi:transcriptional regulator with XRE-family HTH domain